MKVLIKKWSGCFCGRDIYTIDENGVKKLLFNERGNGFFHPGEEGIFEINQDEILDLLVDSHTGDVNTRCKCKTITGDGSTSPWIYIYIKNGVFMQTNDPEWYCNDVENLNKIFKYYKMVRFTPDYQKRAYQRPQIEIQSGGSGIEFYITDKPTNDTICVSLKNTRTHNYGFLNVRNK